MADQEPSIGHREESLGYGTCSIDRQDHQDIAATQDDIESQPLLIKKEPSNVGEKSHNH